MVHFLFKIFCNATQLIVRHIRHHHPLYLSFSLRVPDIAYTADEVKYSCEQHTEKLLLLIYIAIVNNCDSEMRLI
jgi:hypothetical protein